MGIVGDEPTLLWVARLPPGQLGVHIGNRSGAMACLRQALVTGGKHCEAGYSYKKACQGAWAVGASAKGRESKVANGTWSEAVGLPAPSPMVALTFGASH